MARTKGATNKPKTPPAEATAGHNQPTDADQQRLFFNWRKKWNQAKAEVDAAKLDLKEIEKGAKEELGASAVKMLKAAEKLATPEGEAEVKADIERQMQVARWLAIPLGSQTDLFPVDRMPAVDRAAAEGLRDGMEGKSLVNPYAADLPQAAAYAEAWHKGQEKIFGIKAPPDDEKDLRPPFLQQQDESLTGVPATAFE